MSKNLIGKLSELVGEILTACKSEGVIGGEPYEPVDVAALIRDTLPVYEQFIRDKFLNVSFEDFDLAISGFQILHPQKRITHPASSSLPK